MLKSSIKILLVSIAGLAALFSFLNFILLKKEIKITNQGGAKNEARILNQGLPLLPPPSAAIKLPKKIKTVAKEAPAFNVGNQMPRTNVLLLGMSGPGYEAPDLTDTILVLSVDPSGGSATMISLPRDIYVEVPEIEGGRNYYAGYFTKINALYQLNKNSSDSEEFAAGLIKQKVGQITGLEIDNYILMDLEGLKEIIDQIGGLNVFVEKDVFDPRFPTKNFATETFELKSGWRWLDGQTALRYIIKRLWDISRKIDSSSKIKHIVIDANQENGLLEESTAVLGGKTGFILVPKTGVEDYTEIQYFIQNNL